MARTLNGTTDSVIPGASVSNLVSSWTVGGWVKRASSGRTDPIWSRWTNSTTNRQLFFYFTTGVNNNKLQIDIPFIKAVLTGSTAITDTNWHHCVARRSGNAWTIFLDGVSNGSATDATAQETGGSVELGRSTAFGTGFSGAIGEMAAWSIALTDNEILSWSKGNLPSKIRPASLAGYWPVNGISSPEPDFSGLAHNGTVTGTSRSNHPPVNLSTPSRPSWIFENQYPIGTPMVMITESQPTRRIMIPVPY